MKGIKIVVGIICFFLLSISTVEGQMKDNSFDRTPVRDRVYFGGGGGFRTGVHPYYGYRYTYLAVSPMVGYLITQKFSVGTFVNFQHFGYPDQGVSNNQYGLSPFLQYRFGKLFAYAEYSMLSVPTFDNSTRQIYTRLPIGLGYSMPLGGKASINAMALYDVKYRNNNSAFVSPWIIRVFISAGNISF